MHPVAGISIVVVASVLAVVTGGWLRTRLPQPAVDLLMAVAGAGIGVGGLMTLDDVGPASWIVAPTILALIALLQARALFAREGPFRT
jgi:hypothetical protein